ncbi:MAG: GntR family transcriptional regulator [Muribaculaceae bacterium]
MKFNENKAIYLQIADRVCEDIILGTYTEAGRIPSVREYAQMIEVSANTVARSFDYLQQQGVLLNRRGVGLFVADNAVEAIKRMRREVFLSEELDPFMRQAVLLDISEQELLTAYRRHLNELKK